MALKTFFFVLASIYVTFADLIKECPPKESTTSCVCIHSKPFFPGGLVHFQCNALSSQKSLEGTVKALKGYSIASLTLERVNASTMSTDLFQGMHVTLLALKHFEVDDASSAGLGHSSFSGLENSLQWLHILNSFERTGPLSGLKLDRLHSLKTIVLLENKIPEIGNDWITGPKSLETLIARKNGIEKLGDEAFASLTNLEVLDIRDNHLKEISRSMLPSPANHLNHLDITGNKIRTLPKDIFSKMPALKYIYMSHNLINTLPEDTWSPVLSQLKFVEFYGNPLQCDQDLKWVCDQSKYIIATECASPIDKKDLSLYQFCQK